MRPYQVLPWTKIDHQFQLKVHGQRTTENLTSFLVFSKSLQPLFWCVYLVFSFFLFSQKLSIFITKNLESLSNLFSFLNMFIFQNIGKFSFIYNTSTVWKPFTSWINWWNFGNIKLTINQDIMSFNIVSIVLTDGWRRVIRKIIANINSYALT